VSLGGIIWHFKRSGKKKREGGRRRENCGWGGKVGNERGRGKVAKSSLNRRRKGSKEKEISEGSIFNQGAIAG